jgi:hypothetical protein
MEVLAEKLKYYSSFAVEVAVVVAAAELVDAVTTFCDGTIDIIYSIQNNKYPMLNLTL